MPVPRSPRSVERLLSAYADLEEETRSASLETKATKPPPGPNDSPLYVVRGRERTRRPGVLRLLERKHAEQEKEKRRELRRSIIQDCQWPTMQQQQQRRSRSAGATSHSESVRTVINLGVRDGNGSGGRKTSYRSEAIFVRELDDFEQQKRPEIDEQDLETKEDVRKKEVSDGNKETLRSADLLRNLGSSGRKRSFTTEKRLYVHDDNTISSLSSPECSPESKSFHKSSSCFDFFNAQNVSMAERRDGLEERLRCRSANRSSDSSDDSMSDRETNDAHVDHGQDTSAATNASATSRLLLNLSTNYYQNHKDTDMSSTKGKKRGVRNLGGNAGRKLSDDATGRLLTVNKNHSRKISLPPTCPDVAEETGATMATAAAATSAAAAASATAISNRSAAEAKKDEGNELFRTKQYREALQCYSDAIELDDGNAALYSNRSACHLMLGEYSSALSDGQTAIRLDSAFVRGYIRVAKSAIMMGDTITAEKALERAEHLDKDNMSVAHENKCLQALNRAERESNRAFDNGDFRTTLYYVDQSLSLAPGSGRLRTKRAECLARLGRVEEAEQIAVAMLRSDASNADALYVRGLCLYLEDNLDKAFHHFQQVLKLAPDHHEAKSVYKRARLLKQKKDAGNEAFRQSSWSSAYALYTEALALDPQNSVTNSKLYFNRGTVAAKMGRYEESVADCSAAIDIQSDYLKALVRRGHSYLALEKFEAALSDFERAQHLDKFNDEYRRLVHRARAEVRRRQHQHRVPITTTGTDYYKVLGVSKDANNEAIKKAYKQRALLYHPDRHVNASEAEQKEAERKFKEVAEAYSVLSDSKKRTRHDVSSSTTSSGFGSNDWHEKHNFGFGSSFGMDANDVFSAFFGSSSFPRSNHFSFQFA